MEFKFFNPKLQKLLCDLGISERALLFYDNEASQKKHKIFEASNFVEIIFLDNKKPIILNKLQSICDYEFEIVNRRTKTGYFVLRITKKLKVNVFLIALLWFCQAKK